MAVAAKRYFDRGMAALHAGDASSAAEALSAAVELAPTFAPASQWLVVAHARLGALSAATSVANNALARAPIRSDALWLWILVADVHFAAGRIHDAMSAYEQASSLLDAGNTAAAKRIAMGKARVAAAQGNWSAAVTALAASSG